MKKLKLRGKELKRIGYTDDRSIALALNIVNDKSTSDASMIAYNGTLILRSNENLYCLKKMN